MKLNFTVILLFVIIFFGCSVTTQEKMSDLKLSDIEYIEFKKKLFQYKKHPNLDSIIKSYITIADYAKMNGYDHNALIQKEIELQEMNILSDIQDVLGREVTKSITINDTGELDSTVQFLNKKVEFTAVYSMDYDYLIRLFNNSKNNHSIFNRIVAQKKNKKLIIRNYTSDWPRFLPIGDYRKAILNSHKGDILGPILSDDGVSFLRIDDLVKKDVSNLSQDSIRNVTLLLKKHSYINNVFGKCIYDAKININHDAINVLRTILKSKEINDVTNDRLNYTLATYVDKNIIQKVTPINFFKYNDINSLRFIKNDIEKLSSQLYQHCKKLVVYNYSMDNKMDTLARIRALKKINKTIILHNFMIEKLAKDSIINNQNLIKNFYNRQIKRYTSHNKLVVVSIQFTNIVSGQKTYRKYRNAIFDGNLQFPNSFNLKDRESIEYNSVSDIRLKQILFFYNVIDKGDVRFYEDDNGVVTIYKIIEKEGFVPLPFKDIKGIVEVDLLKNLKAEIKHDIIIKNTKKS